MPKPIAVQLYTLRQDVEKNGFETVLKTVAGIGYGHVELAGMYNKSATDFKRSLDNNGLKAIGAHVPFLDPAKREQLVADAKTLGYRHVIGSMGKSDFESEDKVKATAEKINEAISYFAPKGLQVTLHNHEWEYTGPKKMELLLELCPKVSPQIDVYWVQTGGADPVQTIKRYGARTYILHIKDGPADGKNRDLPMTAVGQGKVDIASCIRAAEVGSVEYLTVELDHCATCMEQAVRDSYNFLTQRSLAQGTR
jgi:sugar phosphate isomerase/epimerase